MTFFEIDPIVIEAASDPRLFTFLSDAPRRPNVVLGDARLSLAGEPSAIYDLLIMDAFTSDSVPIHLLTVEGITDEVRTLAPDGVIAFNVSSRYYDLSPAIAAALAELDVVTLRKSGAGKGSVFLPSLWIAASRSPVRLDSLRALGWEASPVADRPFTDDYADLLSYLHLGP
jgi:spermidine synthase